VRGCSQRLLESNYRRALTPSEETIVEVLARLGYYDNHGLMRPLDMSDEVANRDRSLCDDCGAEEDAYWAEMWSDYARSRL